MRGTRQLLGYQLGTAYAVCIDCADEHRWLRYGPGRVGIYDYGEARTCVVCQDTFAGPITGLVMDSTEERESIAP